MVLRITVPLTPGNAASSGQPALSANILFSGAVSLTHPHATKEARRDLRYLKLILNRLGLYEPDPETGMIDDVDESSCETPFTPFSARRRFF